MNNKLYTLIYKKIEEKKKFELPFVVGINGIDYAGKTRFGDKFRDFLETQGHSVELIHVDDFYNGHLDESFFAKINETYLEDVYNFSRIINEILLPIKQCKTLDKSVKLWNIETKKYDLEKRYTVKHNSIVLIEGVFLFQPQIVPFLDYKVMLLISKEEAEKRALTRESKYFKKSDCLHMLRNEFLPAQEIFVEKMNPLSHADLVIDNEDWHNPKPLKNFTTSKKMI